MRGTYDFETANWTQPVCCGLYMKIDSTTEHFDFIHEAEQDVSLETLLRMAQYNEAQGITEWWAHNGGKFDTLLLMEAALKANFKMVGIPAAGRLIRLDVYVPLTPGNFTRVRLLDSYAVVQASLADALTQFQIETKKVFSEADYKALEQDGEFFRKMPLDKLKAGSYADCKGLYQMLDKVEQQCVAWGGTLKSTYSSCAMGVLKSKLKDDGLEIPQHGYNQDLNEICSNAYYGGRVEVFHHNPSKSVNEYDVNSSYPWAMTHSMPWQLYGTSTELTLEELRDSEFEAICFAQVATPSSMHIPILPYRPKEGGMYFPTGQWEGWYALPELVYAQEKGCIVRLIRSIIYTREEPFDSFIKDVYRYKCTHEGAAREFAKRVLNGCYGKFAQHPERERLVIFGSDAEGLAYSVEHNTRKLRTWRAQAEKVFQWSKTTHYAIASYITAWSRVLLHQRLAEATEPSYCDTDSVHCTDYKLESNVHALLGGLKHEGTFYDCRYYAPKLYEMHEPVKAFANNPEIRKAKREAPKKFKGHYTSKGFPVKEDIFRKVVTGQEIKVSRMQLAKMQLRNDGSAERVEQLKRWGGRSMKRYAFSNGQTRPWSVSELLKGEHLTMKSPLFTPPLFTGETK